MRTRFDGILRWFALLRKKLSQLEFDGFTITTVLGFVPFPAPQWKKRRTGSRGSMRRSVAKTKPKPRPDPITDTMENLRQDALDDGDYFTAFATAIGQNVYEQNQKRTKN